MHPRFLAKTRAEILQLLIEARALVNRGRPAAHGLSDGTAALRRAKADTQLVAVLVDMMGWVVAVEALPPHGRSRGGRLPTLRVRIEELTVSADHPADDAVAQLGLRARSLHGRLTRIEGELMTRDVRPAVARTRVAGSRH